MYSEKKYLLSIESSEIRSIFTKLRLDINREHHEAAKQMQSSLTCRDVVKKTNVVIQIVKVIPSSNLRPRWWTMEVEGIPQNESEAVGYLQKKMLCHSFLF